MKDRWKTHKLGDVCQVIGGGTPPKNRADFYSGDIPWATVRDMRREVITETEYKITNDAVKRSATNVIPRGNVVIATRVGLGKVCLLDQDTAINQDLRGIVPNDAKALTVRFLFWWLKSIAHLIEQEGTGATVLGVKLPFIKSLQVPLPSPAEQQRIVGILDEVFEGIAKAKTNAEKNLQNARALFASHLQLVLTKRGKGWVDRTLDEVCIVERGSSPRPIKEYFTTKPDGVNWIKIGDTEEGGKYVYSTAQKIRPEGAKHSRFVKEGDFILTNSMSFGRPYIMKTSGYIHDGWFVLRLNMAIDTNYFYYLLSSSVVQAQFASLASGSVVKNISGDLVKKAVLPIPPLEQQHMIVEELSRVSAETQRLESLYRQKLAALDDLRKSLLHQAFAGELTVRPRKSVVLPFPTRIPNITTTDLHAGILAISYQLHEKHGKQNSFGHVKAEKVSHMIEAHVGIDLGRAPVKDAAGPDDYPHLLRVEHRARNAGFFLFRRTARSGYKLAKSRRFDFLINKTRLALGDRNPEVDALLRLMLPMDKEQSEILATVYAAWNNLLIERQQITDEAVVLSARENWHPDKLSLERDRFFRAINWMKKQGVIPMGKGKKVVSSVKKKNAKRSRNKSRTH